MITSPLCIFCLVSLSLVSVYLFPFLRRFCLSIVQYHICQTARPISFFIVQYSSVSLSPLWRHFPTSPTLLTSPCDHISSYLLSHIQFVPAPFQFIHSSVPHVPDSHTIFLLHSPVHYHMCKVCLFQVIPARIRTCELSHHSLAHYQLSKLDSDGYPCKIRVFIL